VSRQRSRSRSLAIQALYQWQMAGQDVGAIINHFMIEQDAKKFDTDYFSELVRGVPARLGELDLALASCIDRALESVDPVERAILRLGAYELMEHPEIPYRVVINEAVELAKTLARNRAIAMSTGFSTRPRVPCVRWRRRPGADRTVLCRFPNLT